MLLARFGLRTNDFDTAVVVEHGRAYTKSSAALRIARNLGGWWSLLAVLFAIPPFLRDGAYDVLAQPLPLVRQDGRLPRAHTGDPRSLPELGAHRSWRPSHTTQR